MNWATVGLFNNSLGAYYLIVRSIRVSCTTTEGVGLSYQNSKVGTAAGIIENMIPTGATPPGQIAAIDSAVQFPPDYSLQIIANQDAFLPHDFPIAVIEPGWSFVLQDLDKTFNLIASIIYEYITPDELDFFR